MNRKILILGANGMAGHLITTGLREDLTYFDVISVARTNSIIEPDLILDVSNFKELETLVKKINPEILIIDEALSTGDASFKEKSSQRIDDLANQAKTLIVVSHALGTIQELCTEVIWLDHGNLIKRGNPEEIVAAYTKFLNVGDIASVMEDF